MALRRILKEHDELVCANCCIELENEDLYRWRLTTAVTTPYFDTPIQFTLNVHFPTDYPFKQPKFNLQEATPSILFLKNNLVFIAAICRENVMGYGWDPSKSIQYILDCITKWLNYCDGDLTTYNLLVNEVETELCIRPLSGHLQPCKCNSCKHDCADL